LAISPNRYDITILGAEPYPNYNRLRLSEVLKGEKSFNDIVLNPLEWYEQKGIRLHLGKPVEKIDRALRKVVTADGTEVLYDRLLIATGSTPIILPVPGNRLKGVITYHDIYDTQAMIDAAAVKRHVVVIGGGLQGLEVANGLKLRGMKVTVVQLADISLERQLDATTGKQLQRSLEMRGFEFLPGKSIVEIISDDAGEAAGVRFADGETLPADLIVMAAGSRPNIAVAQAAGLSCDAGIVVGDELKTSDRRIYAVGECVSHRGIAFGLVAPLYEQAKAAADHFSLIKECACHLALTGIGSCKSAMLSTRP
jgi:nitrite reductase (NADH) large subunit